MATNTNTNTSRQKGLEHSIQPDYGRNTWNDTTGRPGSSDNGRDYSGTGDNGGGFYSGKKGDAAQSAVDDLRGAEQGALSKKEPSYYTGNGGKSKKDNDDGRFAPKLNSKIKKKGHGRGAIITILLMLVGGGAFLGTSNSLLAPAIEALFTAATDTQYASATARSARLMKIYLGTDVPVNTNWRGVQKYTHISNSFKNRLAKQGIEIEGTGSSKFLVFKQELPDGSFTTKNITAGDFEATFLGDAEFRNAYTKAKRGRVATFFDNIADKIYKKLGLSRNLFAKYKQTNDLDADVDAYRDTMSPKFDGDSTTLSTTNRQEVDNTDSDGNQKPILDADGNPTGEYEPATVIDNETTRTDPAKTSGSDLVEASSKASMMLDSITKKVGIAEGIGSAACALVRVGNMISIAVAANEIYQSINYFMGQVESISKMKAGYGDTSAVNAVLNFMTTTSTTRTTNLGKLTVSNASSDTPTANYDTSNDLEQTGAPIEANGALMILAGNKPNANTTKVFSLERVMNSIGAAFSTSVVSMATCAGVDIATGIAEGILAISTAILTGGLSAVFAGLVGKVIVGTAIGLAVSAFFQFLIPTIAQSLFTNVFETATGIPAGELFAKGASAANTRLGRNGSGQSLSSKSAALAYNQVNNTVLALDAELDRLNHSPFDITNRNTFFGSIAYSLLPVLTSSKTYTISSFIKTTATSLASITGRVSASGEGSSYMTTFGECPNLNAIKAVGDIYCNPVTSTDVETLNLDPNDSTYQEVLKEAQDCDDDGNCTIKNDSDLAKYITYCDGRDSPFGVVDQNILAALQPTDGFGSLGTVLNSIPLIGDIAGLIDGASDLKNLDWANGQKCGNTDLNSEFWTTKGRYYQRYVEDMRLLENMGSFEDTSSKNPVTAYIEQYEAEHPIDNTYIGYLSRISGLTPENTEGVLAFITYYDFVNNYDASTRIAMEGSTSDIKGGEEIAIEIMQNTIYFENGEFVETPANSTIVANNQYIVYADVRNRSYAV